MKKILFLVSILAAGLMLCSAMPAFAYVMEVDEVIWEYDPYLNPKYFSASVEFKATDKDVDTFTIVLTNLTKPERPLDAKMSDSWFPSKVLLTGLGFSLPEKYAILDGVVSKENYVPQKDSLPAWGYDNYKIQGPFADVATLPVNTVISTLEAAAAKRKEDGMFKPGNPKDLNGPSDGVLSEYFKLDNFPYFSRSMFIEVKLNQKVEDWEEFFASINKGNVVVAFGSPSPAVPEPATMFLLGAGLIGMATFGRRKLFKK